MFDHLIWLTFCKNFFGCLGVGTLASLAIALNLRVQKKFRSKSGFRSNFIQAITYVGSVGLVTPITIVFFSTGIIDGKDALPIEIAAYVAGLVMPIIISVLSGFISKPPK